jgi:hypothetical protein
MILGPVNRP